MQVSSLVSPMVTDARLLVIDRLWTLAPEPIHAGMSEAEIEAACRRVIHRLGVQPVPHQSASRQIQEASHAD